MLHEKSGIDRPKAEMVLWDQIPATEPRKPNTPTVSNAGGRNQTKPLLGIETRNQEAISHNALGRNQTKPLLGIETLVQRVQLAVVDCRNQTKPLLGIETA